MLKVFSEIYKTERSYLAGDNPERLCKELCKEVKDVKEEGCGMCSEGCGGVQ